MGVVDFAPSENDALALREQLGAPPTARTRQPAKRTRQAIALDSIPRLMILHQAQSSTSNHS